MFLRMDCAEQRDVRESGMKLTEAQQAQVKKAFPECHEEMARYLATGAKVVIGRQNDVPEAPPFAITVSGTDFWIDCCNTEAEAVHLCESLGLTVVQLRGH